MEYGKRFLFWFLCLPLFQVSYGLAEQRFANQFIGRSSLLEHSEFDQPLKHYIQNDCDINRVIIQGKTNPQTHLVGEHCQLFLISGQSLAPVGSQHALARMRRQEKDADILSLTALPNSIVPGFGGLTDGRQRVEMTTGIFPIQTLEPSALDKSKLGFKQATKSMMRDQWPTRDAFQFYEWVFRLPIDFHDNLSQLTAPFNNRQSYLDPKMSVIIAQWHGTPDRLSYRFPDEKPWVYHQLDMTGNNTEAYQETLSEYQKLKQQGALFDQGGFPPLALKIQDGYIALIANYYRYRVHDRRLTGCPKLRLTGENAAQPGEFYVCDYQDFKLKRYDTKESIQWVSWTTLVWKAALDEIGIEHWQSLRLSIHWPRWQADNPEELQMGLLQFDAGTLKTRVSIPLGNNDDAYPYFKLGVYKSRKSKHLPV
jgi:hypothetical protein